MPVSCEFISLGNNGNILKIDFSDDNSVTCNKTLNISVRGIIVTYT